jgi:hypothetical protein
MLLSNYWLWNSIYTHDFRDFTAKLTDHQASQIYCDHLKKKNNYKIPSISGYRHRIKNYIGIIKMI